MNEQQLYRFGAFALRADENVLHRDGKAVPLTPKMFDMLLVLVKNRGQIVEKETLLKEVWPDSFVEEGNITFNIRQLRKALGDDAQSPIFIETVPRRGYRFIADVEQLSPMPDPLSGNGNLPQAGQVSAATVPAYRKLLSPITAGVVLLVTILAIGGWILLTEKDPLSFPILNSPFASEKLSTTGMVYSAAISPDGKKVVYSNRAGSKQSVWLRDLDSGSNVPIIPASEEDYYEIVFSPDGNSIYFSRGTRGIEKHIDIFRASVFGGVPEKIAGLTEGLLGVSPDGKKISFARCPHTGDEWCSLWIADAIDGKNERKLTTRPKPIRIADNEISPDGAKIAFAVGHSRNQANEFRLMEIDIESGVERDISTERFFNIKNLAWLPDQSGILLTASRIPNKHFRIWQVPASSGVSEPMTKDSEAYGILSLNKTADLLVATQIKQDFRLYDFNLEDPSEKRLLADAARGGYSSDGKIYFASTMSGNDEIWSIRPDGSEQRQLTNEPGGDGSPIGSPDGKTIFFTSNRSGQGHVWRMNADGSSQSQLTQKEGGAALFVSPDGKLLYYKHAITETLWSVSLETNEEKVVLDKVKSFFAFSPDGTTIAFEERKGDDLFLTLVAATGGNIILSLRLPRERPRLVEFAWLPDGKSLMYLMAEIDFSKNIIYQQPINGEAPKKIVDLEGDQPTEAYSLTISPDGKRFALVQGGWKHDAVLLKGLR